MMLAIDIAIKAGPMNPIGFRPTPANGLKSALNPPTGANIAGDPPATLPVTAVATRPPTCFPANAATRVVAVSPPNPIAPETPSLLTNPALV